MVVGIRSDVARGFSRSGQRVTAGRGAPIRHYESHSGLVRRLTLTPSTAEKPPALDAIVVPAARPAYNLEAAITLARAAGCPLVILCSRDARPAEVLDLLDARSFSAATVVEVESEYEHEFFEFETTDWIKHEFPARNSDLSIKRNVGLALSRLLAWQRIFFMDDDIRDLDADALRATVSLISGELPEQQYNSAGMWPVEFPDNSVVCHARRMIGKRQDVFVSGSALAVNCTTSFDFFPDIYNEDWLFFYQDAAEKRLGASGYTTTQLTYDPFADSQRAANQEFGDVIAEGLYALLEEELSAEHATVERWTQFIADRKQMLDEIIDQSAHVSGKMREKMLYAVQIARKNLEQIKPETCVDYVECWRRDLALWETRLKNLEQVPKMTSIADALGWLGLKAATRD
jgi:hypothetical protein